MWETIKLAHFQNYFFQLLNNKTWTASQIPLKYKWFEQLKAKDSIVKPHYLQYKSLFKDNDFLKFCLFYHVREF